MIPRIKVRHIAIKAKKIKPGRRENKKLWIQEWLRYACDRKNKFYEDCITSPTTENDNKYKKMKKFVKKGQNQILQCIPHEIF